MVVHSLLWTALLFMLRHSACDELFTSGQHIVSASGQRIRLKCVNWYGAHMELFVSGGMEINSITNITKQILGMGSNCVRLPFSIDLWRINPIVDARGIGPWILPECSVSNATALAIFDCQIRILTDAGIFVILNNHNSWAGWVGTDAAVPQGLWDLPNYTVYDWLDCLEQMAIRYRDNDMVVGMDIRNEPYDCYDVQLTWGKTDNIKTDWKAASSLAAQRIEKVNSKMLIIVSGLCRGYEIGDMIKQVGPESAMSRRKLVYTTHVYVFGFWWTLINWQKVYWISLAIFIVSSLIGARLYKAFQTIPFPGYRVMLAAFAIALGPFALVWLGVAVGWIYALRLVACSILERDAYPLLTISCVLIAACAWCARSHWPPKAGVTLGMLFCAVVSVHATALFALAVMTDSYAMVELELARWQVTTAPVPVWVGEFGNAWYQETPEWRHILRFVRAHGLDFAYWPLNGRKWWQGAGRYVDEEFGLLDTSYRRLRNRKVVDYLFNDSSTVTY